MAGSSRHDAKIALDVIEAVPAAIAEIDVARTVRFVNRVWTEWFAGGRRKMIGRPLQVVAEAVASAFQNAIDSALGGETIAAEAHVDARDLRATCVPRRDDDGAVVGVVLLLADVTEEKTGLAC